MAIGAKRGLGWYIGETTLAHHPKEAVRKGLELAERKPRDRHDEFPSSLRSIDKSVPAQLEV